VQSGCQRSPDFRYCSGFITLAGAAEGQIDEKLIPEGTVAHIFRILRSVWAKEPVNEDITWMKHPSGADDREKTQFHAVLTVARAIHKYVGAYQETHQKFEDFSARYFLH